MNKPPVAMYADSWLGLWAWKPEHTPELVAKCRYTFVFQALRDEFERRGYYTMLQLVDASVPPYKIPDEEFERIELWGLQHDD